MYLRTYIQRINIIYFDKKINAFHSVKPVSKGKGKTKHVHSSFAFHMTVIVIFYVF